MKERNVCNVMRRKFRHVKEHAELTVDKKYNKYFSTFSSFVFRRFFLSPFFCLFFIHFLSLLFFILFSVKQAVDDSIFINQILPCSTSVGKNISYFFYFTIQRVTY